MRAEVGWRWRCSRTGLPLRRVTTPGPAVGRMGTVAPGPGRVTVVVDLDDDVGFARMCAAGCRRVGRFVVHTSPRLRWLSRLQSEVLYALGKDWDRSAQGTTTALDRLVSAWLRVERARELVVLRAHEVTGPAAGSARAGGHPSVVDHPRSVGRDHPAGSGPSGGGGGVWRRGGPCLGGAPELLWV